MDGGTDQMGAAAVYVFCIHRITMLSAGCWFRIIIYKCIEMLQSFIFQELIQVLHASGASLSMTDFYDVIVAATVGAG